MSEFSGIPPIWTRSDVNALVDHALEKPCSFLIFSRTIDGTTYYYAQYGSGANQAGKIAYGGPNNAGGVSGTNASAVIQAAMNALVPGVIWLKDIPLPSTVSIPDNILVIVSINDRLSLIGKTIVVPSETNLPFLRSYEPTRNLYTKLSDFENLAAWTKGVGGTLTTDTVNFKEGSQGIKWTSVNNEITMGDLVVSLNLDRQHFRIWLYIDDVANLQELAFFFTNLPWTAWFSHYYLVNRLQTGWNMITVSQAQFLVAGSPDWATITRLRIRVRSYANTTVNVTFDDYLAVRNQYAGKVTLMFDDAMPTQYTEARKSMDVYNMRGVAAVQTGQIGLDGRMTVSQLEHLQERGWDIISHSVTHPYLDEISLAEVDYELRESQRWLIEKGFLKGARFFASPYNRWNPNIRELAKRYYIAVRPYDGLYEVLPPNPYNILCKIVVNTTSVNTIKGMLDKTKQYDAWLILLFHHISTPADAETKYTPENFRLILDYINTLGLEVVTFSDVFDSQLGILDRKVTENSGTATFSGTGAQTVFTIVHGCAFTPTYVSLEAKSADASGAKYWSADGTNITVTFVTAPPAGTNNIVIGWKAEV